MLFISVSALIVGICRQSEALIVGPEEKVNDTAAGGVCAERDKQEGGYGSRLAACGSEQELISEQAVTLCGPVDMRADQI